MYLAALSLLVLLVLQDRKDEEATVLNTRPITPVEEEVKVLKVLRAVISQVPLEQGP
jgi:hypothetical protein